MLVKKTVQWYNEAQHYAWKLWYIAWSLGLCKTYVPYDNLNHLNKCFFPKNRNS